MNKNINNLFDKFPNDTKMHIVNPTYDQIIIKPPKQNVTHGRKTLRLLIDSRDRNTSIYPNPGDYQIDIPEQYRDVISVQLIKAMIPNSTYIITNNCNKIYFRESFYTILCAEVSPGDYNISELLYALQHSMNIVGTSEYTLSLDKITHKVSIQSNLVGGDHIFDLLFCNSTEKYGNGDTKKRIYPPGSIGPKLGFSTDNLGAIDGLVSNLINSNKVLGTDGITKFTNELMVGDLIRIGCSCDAYEIKCILSDYEIIVDRNIIEENRYTQLYKNRFVGKYKYNLCTEPYVILDIKELDRVDGYSTSLNDSFAILPLTSVHNKKNFIGHDEMGQSSEIKYFNPPLPRLQKLTIKFKTYDGNIVDFNGLDHYLDFEILTLNQSGKYNVNAFS